MGEPSKHFTVGTGVVLARRGRGEIVARDGKGSMTVTWEDGTTSVEHPYALAHEVSGNAKTQEPGR